MDPAFFLGAICGALLCFVLRAFPRIGRPLIGHDTWADLLVVDELKKGHGYNGVCKYFLIEGDHDYPPLLFYFLSMFPSSWLERYNWVINPILDSLNSVVLFSVTYALGQSTMIALVAAIIYSITPAVLQESLNFNTRIFGLVAFNLAMSSLVLHFHSGQSVYLACVIAFGIVVLLSHKFATQVLFLLLVSYAILLRSYVPLMALSATIIGAIVVSRGFYVKVFLGHIGIMRFWLRHYKEYGLDYTAKLLSKSEEGILNRDGPKDIHERSIRSLWHKTRIVNPLYWLVRICPFNPFGLVPVLILLFVPFQIPGQRVVLYWSVLTLAFFYVATYVRFLGHHVGSRQFLDYNAFPSAFLCGVFLLESLSPLRLLLILVVVVLSLVQNTRAWTRVRLYNRSDDQSLLLNIFAHLRSSNKDGVLCLPASHTFAIPYFSGKKVFYTMSARNYEKLAAFFPVLSVPLDTLIKEYNINFVLVDTTIVPVSVIDQSTFKPIIDENGYVLFEKFS